MTVSLLHLTDLHFTIKTKFESKINSLCRSVLNSITTSKFLVIILSGDIANTGKKVEYDIAKKFLSNMKLFILGERKDLQIYYVIVPGNHDCNFDYDTNVRKQLLKVVNYETIGNDNSLFDVCLPVQNDFWNFYSNYNEVPKDKIFYQIELNMEGIKLKFNCFNTSWNSQINESPGSLFFPIKRYNSSSVLDSTINLGVWHHPLNWFNPNTSDNNKREIEIFVENTNTFNFFGHEHEHSFKEVFDKTTSNSSSMLSGELFSDDKKPNKSGFQILTLKILEKKGEVSRFQWNDDLYVQKDNLSKVDFEVKKRESILSNDVFLKNISKMNLPISFENRKEILLSDLFVFPDLEQSTKDIDIFEKLQNSSKVLNKDDFYAIIDGESQIGKSSLCNMLYVKSFEENVYPLLINGEDLEVDNINKIIKKKFFNQYQTTNFGYDKYTQLPKKEKFLIVDNFQNSTLRGNEFSQLLSELKNIFGKAIFVTDTSYGLLSTLKNEESNLKFFTIKPFGYKKRNELIEKYHIVKDGFTNEETFLEDVKRSFENVQSILGDKLMPPLPIYIISILQALQYKPLKQNETSFGYCYQTLIHFSLHKAGVPNDDLDSYLNFLGDLAFLVIKKEGNESISHTELTEFYTDYAKRFIAPAYETLITSLRKSKILSIEDGKNVFGYKYILYYLSAKKISDILSKKEGKEFVQELFNNLHKERNANILVFITHHSKDIDFIQQSIIKSMYILDSIKPITLEKDDKFYKELQEFVQKIKNDIIKVNTNAKIERDNQLIKEDEKIDEKKINNESTKDNEIDEVILPFLQSFRSIEIVGQIVKNRKGSLEIGQLTEMVTELYTTAFRTIAYYNEILSKAKSDIVDMINANLKDNDSKIEIEKKVNDFIQLISFKVCLAVFGKIMHTVGSKELKKIYSNVALSLGTTAAKLVSFSINSYYGTIVPKDLKDLADEFKGNIVALNILKFRVKSYIYNRNLDYSTKQKLASSLNMRLESHLKRD